MLPLLYHIHHSRHPEDIPFWLRLADQKEDPLLELGCGTGRVLLPLAQAGHQMVGLDSNPEMLRFLRGLLLGSAQPVFNRVQLLLADMSAFQLARQFSLILLPCNTLSTLDDPARKATLKAVRNHLAPDGLFVASLPNPAELNRFPEEGEPEVEDIFAHPLSGNPIQVSSSWMRTDQHFVLRWHYDHLLPDGQVQHYIVEAKHSLLPVASYLASLKAAGLQLDAIYGDYDRSPYTSQSPYLILLAKRTQLDLPA